MIRVECPTCNAHCFTLWLDDQSDLAIIICDSCHEPYIAVRIREGTDE